jgi:ATP-binding cassette subfamily A (ABC1) protein 3
MTFQLPTEAHLLFKQFFTLLDDEGHGLGIQSYGVGITTLEEVFLRIGKGHEEEDEIAIKSSSSNRISEESLFSHGSVNPPKENHLI